MCTVFFFFVFGAIRQNANKIRYFFQTHSEKNLLGPVFVSAIHCINCALKSQKKKIFSNSGVHPFSAGAVSYDSGLGCRPEVAHSDALLALSPASPLGVVQSDVRMCVFVRPSP
jgi:hypothetical protein